MAEVVKANQFAPQMIVDLYAEHLTILDQGPDSFVVEIMGRDPSPSLADFEHILNSLNDQAEAVRMKSADTLCTGLFRYA